MRKTSSLSLSSAAIALVAGLLALGAAVSCGGNSSQSTTTSGSGTGTSSQHTTSSSSSMSAGGGGAGGSFTTSTTASTTSGGTGGAKACATDGDCAGNPKGGVCDTSTGMCVGCVPSNDTCPMGQVCDATTETCTTGCKSSSDCTVAPDTLCDPTSHMCSECLMDSDCPLGQLCGSGSCYPGCSATQGCPMGQTCCGTYCADTTTDVKNCGACGTKCPTAANAVEQCTNGMCSVGSCKPGWADCDGNMLNGCEWNTFQDGPCTCTPGATQACYQGPPGTQNKGICKAGTQTCDPSGTSWGPCNGQVLPKAEVCGSNVDNNCDGINGNVPDVDGDGWTACNGDCCEIAGPTCGNNPALVNPGAFEVAGDGIDNNCDGTVDNPVTTTCSTANKFAGVTGMDVANAMDLCQTTTLNATGPNKIWGVISATQLHANGTAATASEAQNSQTAIKLKFGTGGVKPKKNATLAVISSGMARDASDAGWVVPIPGTTFTSTIAFPGAPPLGTYTNAHGGGLLPGQCAGVPCGTGTGANDSIDIRLQIRTPTNAQGFSYDFRFYSAEYQTFQCTSFNDYYLAMLTSGAAGIPADHNISFDSLGNAVSVNNGFFQDCGGNGQGCGTCPFGTASLAGTGFDNASVNGGSTEWLTTDAPIVPGEVITLDLMVFDVEDQIYDTLILLDNFRWSLTPVTLGTHT